MICRLTTTKQQKEITLNVIFYYYGEKKKKIYNSRLITTTTMMMIMIPKRLKPEIENKKNRKILHEAHTHRIRNRKFISAVDDDDDKFSC